MSFLQNSIKSGIDAYSDVAEALSIMRKHLDMDWSYLSKFKDDGIVFRAVSSRDSINPVSPGDKLPNAHTYCHRVAHGLLPNIIRDTEDFPETKAIPATDALPIRSHVSVPVMRSDGSIYGMFCCLSCDPKPNMNSRDLDVLRMFADLASKSLNAQLDRDEERRNLLGQITSVIELQRLQIHLQPIVSLRTGQIRALEALSRVTAPEDEEPSTRKDVQWWFDRARSTEMQIPFELNAIALALTHLHFLPPKTYLTVNVSPATLSTRNFRQVLQTVPPDRLCVELTEHVEIAETSALLSQLDWLRQQRIGVAIDDVGAGYAGLATILKLQPNVIKLDRSLVKGIEKDPAKQSLVTAMQHFCYQQDAFMIAEGIETKAEHEMLLNMGIRLGQGFAYSRPQPALRILGELSTGNTVFPPKDA